MGMKLRGSKDDTGWFVPVGHRGRGQEVVFYLKEFK